jgi:hypothetical protein
MNQHPNKDTTMNAQQKKLTNIIAALSSFHDIACDEDISETLGALSEVLIANDIGDMLSACEACWEPSAECICNTAGLSQAGEPCGLNADWLNRAWHFGPGDRANSIAGDYYIVEQDDDSFDLVRRFYDDDNDDIVIVASSKNAQELIEAVKAILR